MDPNQVLGLHEKSDAILKKSDLPIDAVLNIRDQVLGHRRDFFRQIIDEPAASMGVIGKDQDRQIFDALKAVPDFFEIYDASGIGREEFFDVGAKVLVELNGIERAHEAESSSDQRNEKGKSKNEARK